MIENELNPKESFFFQQVPSRKAFYIIRPHLHYIVIKRITKNQISSDLNTLN